MIIHMYSLFDTKTGMFNTPFFFVHTGMAIRACMDIGQDLNTSVGRHPEDFVLFRLGTFDDNKGEVMQCMPENLGNVSSFLRPQPPLPFAPQPGHNGQANAPEA